MRDFPVAVGWETKVQEMVSLLAVKFLGVVCHDSIMIEFRPGDSNGRSGARTPAWGVHWLRPRRFRTPSPSANRVLEGEQWNDWSAAALNWRSSTMLAYLCSALYNSSDVNAITSAAAGDLPFVARPISLTYPCRTPSLLLVVAEIQVRGASIGPASSGFHEISFAYEEMKSHVLDARKARRKFEQNRHEDRSLDPRVELEQIVGQMHRRIITVSLAVSGTAEDCRSSSVEKHDYGDRYGFACGVGFAV
nr:hypothetical protein CFP56_69113 [Quercus suber]